MSSSPSNIRDNRTRGTVADSLHEKLRDKVHPSVVSACFTIYAYDAFKKFLDRVSNLAFLFGKTIFVKRFTPSATEEMAFVIDAAGPGLELPDLDDISEDDRLPRLCTLFETLYDGTHPLRIALVKLQTLDAVRVTEGKEKS